MIIALLININKRFIFDLKIRNGIYPFRCYSTNPTGHSPHFPYFWAT
ncbi:hypothetical protein BH09BAC1_BH09BAC1_20860 [soil metagenome]